MSHHDLIAALRALPERIREAEERLNSTDHARMRARQQLQAEEDCHLLSGHTNGRNQAEREAQLRALTAAARRDLESVEEAYRRERIALEHLQNQFSATRAIARLLAAQEE
jgi:hypothetical protein